MLNHNQKPAASLTNTAIRFPCRARLLKKQGSVQNKNPLIGSRILKTGWPIRGELFPPEIKPRGKNVVFAIPSLFQIYQKKFFSFGAVLLGFG